MIAFLSWKWLTLSWLYGWAVSLIPVWVLVALAAHGVVLGSVAYLILLERKVASWVQDRIGPNRVGLGFGIIPKLKDFHFWGFGQPLADGLKFILKEDYRPRGVDAILFTLAPALMIFVIIISVATIPWGGVVQSTQTFNVTWAVNDHQMSPDSAAMARVPNSATFVPGSLSISHGDNLDDGHPTTFATLTYRYPFQIANLNIGVLYILAILSLAVYGVVIGGWASNNKYSFLGGLRATANMISYEIPLGLAVLCIVVMYGTLDLGILVDQQAHYWMGWIPAWNVFTQPLAFVMFLVCIHAEANRAPFDMAEAEQELVGGYHTEYSSMRFALFFLAEYAGMITTSAVCVALFFGGWHLPFLTGNVDPSHPAITSSVGIAVIRSLVFFGKTILIIFVFMWVRWSLPRFRFDQLMMLAWRALIPISLAMLLMTSIVLYLYRGHARPNLWADGWLALYMLAGNVVLLLITLVVSKLLPAPPATNRKLVIPGSRFNRRLPVPA